MSTTTQRDTEVRPPDLLKPTRVMIGTFAGLAGANFCLSMALYFTTGDGDFPLYLFGLFFFLAIGSAAGLQVGIEQGRQDAHRNGWNR